MNPHRNLLIIVATVLFIVACFLPHAWLVPAGLASFALAHL